MRATQVIPTQIVQMGRYSILHRHGFVPNGMARTEFILRPRFARTGVAGHDKLGLRRDVFCGVSRSAERRVQDVHERWRDELTTQKTRA